MCDLVFFFAEYFGWKPWETKKLTISERRDLADRKMDLERRRTPGAKNNTFSGQTGLSSD